MNKKKDFTFNTREILTKKLKSNKKFTEEDLKLALEYRCDSIQTIKCEKGLKYSTVFGFPAEREYYRIEWAETDKNGKKILKPIGMPFRVEKVVHYVRETSIIEDFGTTKPEEKGGKSISKAERVSIGMRPVWAKKETKKK